MTVTYPTNGVSLDLGYPEITSEFGHWLAGFADGEGCFRIRRVVDTYQCLFQIGLHERDSSILREIQDNLGIGNISRFKNSQHPSFQCRWTVTDKSGCLRIVQIFEEFPLRSKKKEDFYIWKQAVHDRATIKYGQPHNWTKIESLKCQLRKRIQ